MGLAEVFKGKLSSEAYYPVGIDSDVMIYYPKEQDEFKMGSELLGISLALEYAIKKFKVDEAQIICFGNNLYGREVHNIWDNHPDIHIEMVVCDSEAEIIRDSDQKTLAEKINLAKSKSNTIVYESQVPPTLRSCILYKEKEPVLCCVQFYLMSVSNRIPSFTGRKTPCTIACHNGEFFPLGPYVKFCEEEFVRLCGKDE